MKVEYGCRVGIIVEELAATDGLCKSLLLVKGV
jgi:hypothetical protein